jgi:transposase
MTKTFSTKEVAERYTVSTKTVAGWERSGELRGICVSRSLASKKKIYRFSESALAEFELLRSSTTTPTTRRRKRKQPNDVIQFYK